MDSVPPSRARDTAARLGQGHDPEHARHEQWYAPGYPNKPETVTFHINSAAAASATLVLGLNLR